MQRICFYTSSVVLFLAVLVLFSNVPSGSIDDTVYFDSTIGIFQSAYFRQFHWDDGFDLFDFSNAMHVGYIYISAHFVATLHNSIFCLRES